MFIPLTGSIVPTGGVDVHGDWQKDLPGAAGDASPCDKTTNDLGLAAVPSGRAPATWEFSWKSGGPPECAQKSINTVDVTKRRSVSPAHSVMGGARDHDGLHHSPKSYCAVNARPETEPGRVVFIVLPSAVPKKTPLNVADPVMELPLRLPVKVNVKFWSELTKVPPKLPALPEIEPTAVSEPEDVEQLPIGQEETATPRYVGTLAEPVIVPLFCTMFNTIVALAEAL